MRGAALSRNNGFIANFEVACEAGLPSDPDSAAQTGRACEADLSRQNRILADLRTVPDLHKVVQFGAAPYDRVADRSPVDGCVGADFHVILYQHPSGLANFVKRTVPGGCESETVAANDDTVLEHHAIPDLAILPDYHMRVKHGSVAYHNARIKNHMRIDHDVRPDFAVPADDGIGSNAGIRADEGALPDHCRRMHACVRTKGDEENLERTSKGEIGIVCSQAGNFDRRNIVAEDDRGGARIFYVADIFSIGDESQVARPGFIDSRNANYFHILIAGHAAFYFACNVRKLHGGCDRILFRAAGFTLFLNEPGSCCVSDRVPREPKPRKPRRLKMLSQDNGMVVLCTRIRQGEAALEFTKPRGNSAPSSTSFAGPGILGPAWSVGAATSISRILGLVREIVLARYFGAGLYTDAFNVAYRIPNLLRDLFAEGALSSAFVPTFVRRLTYGGKEQAWILANRVLSALCVILGAATLAIFLGAKGFVYLLAAGYSAIPEKFALTVQMTQIMSPFLLCVALASVGMGILNACGFFFIPAMASSAFNICCILAGIFLSPIMPRWGLHPILSMAIGALVGGISQFCIMMPSAHGRGFRFRFDLCFSDPDLRNMGRLMFPAIIGLSAAQINITVDYQIAALYGNGPVSWLNYGFRLMQLPIGVFGIAIATAAMATVAHHAAQNAMEKLHQTVRSSLRLAACLTFPATVGLILFRHETVRLLYERGLFLPSDTLMTSRVVLLYALGLFSYSAVKILVPAFYALNDTWTPVRMSAITVGAKIALNILLVMPLGFLGLALATTLASTLNCVLLLRHLGRHTGSAWNQGELVAYGRIAIASLSMGCLAFLAHYATGMILPGPGFWATAGRLGAAIGIGIATLFPLLRALKVGEANEIMRMLSMPGTRP